MTIEGGGERIQFVLWCMHLRQHVLFVGGGGGGGGGKSKEMKVVGANYRRY